MTAVRPATFTGFDPYKLTGVRVTERELGRGSYATVLELEYMGLKCAGKKIHELLLEQGDASYAVRRFEEECRILSQVRHPNIVQFLGVYFQQRVRAPILVLEFLPTNLTSCIEQYGILSKEITYSILHDVALGLCYLHSQTPPIIHRDLSSNNVLLTPNMTAKISDLGVARILNLTPLQISCMTQNPGTRAYMPPETMIPNPSYNVSIDEFSYGIMMIHMFSGSWPEPQAGQVHSELDGRMTPVSEAERREVFLRAIGNDHPLMDLILKCIHNHQQARPHATEIVERLAEMVLQFPASFASRLDEALRQYEAALRQNEELAKENRYLREVLETKDREIQRLKDEIEWLKIENTTAGLNLQDLSPSQLVQINMTWKQCSRIPTKVNDAKTTVISGKVYCDGGFSCTVYCYDPPQDKWTTLPPLPVCFYGLGQLRGKLVAAGGRTINEQYVQQYTRTNNVYTYDERSQQWMQTIPPMPTARDCMHVLSLPSALVVAGGCTVSALYTKAVEIFKPDTSQWYRTDPLPIASCQIPLIAIGSTCYAVGGFDDSYLNQVFSASVDELLGNAVPANQLQSSSHGSSHTQSAWNRISNTPTYGPTGAMLAGNLLAIGGNETSDEHTRAFKKEVYMYSPSANSWIYIGDLPDPIYGPGIAVLSSMEFLVIGGGGFDRDYTDTVCKGTLHLKP